MDNGQLYKQFREVVEAENELPCQNAPDLFFALDLDDKKAGTSLPYAYAKKLCAECPIRVECLAYAVEADEPYGVWGGLTTRERKRLYVGKTNW